MTSEEAIKKLKEQQNEFNEHCIDYAGINKAYNMAIEALEQRPYDVSTNGSIFLKTYHDSQFANIAYEDGICYVYVDLRGSRTRFTSDWWNASYKADKEE